MNEWHVPVAASRGAPELRNGNRFPMNANIGNVFRTRDGRLLTVSAAAPSLADRLLVMVGGGALRDDSRFSTTAACMANMDALDAIVAEWMARHDAAEAMRLVRENDVVVGPIHDAGDILADAHVAARGNVVRVPTEEGSMLPMPAALPLVAEDAPRPPPSEEVAVARLLGGTRPQGLADYLAALSPESPRAPNQRYGLRLTVDLAPLSGLPAMVVEAGLDDHEGHPPAGPRPSGVSRR